MRGISRMSMYPSFAAIFQISQIQTEIFSAFKVLMLYHASAQWEKKAKKMFWNGFLELWRREMGDVLGSKNLNNLLRRIRWDFYQTNKFICDVNSQDHWSFFNKDLLLLKPATDLWPSFAAPAGKSISGFLLFPLDWQNSPNKPKITLIECLKFLGLDWFADVS